MLPPAFKLQLKLPPPPPPPPLPPPPPPPADNETTRKLELHSRCAEKIVLDCPLLKSGRTKYKMMSDLECGELLCENQCDH